MKYIVENFEETIGLWVKSEYKHMVNVVGADNVVIANVDAKKKEQLDPSIPTDPRHGWDMGFDPARVCLLDLRAEKELGPEDKGAFDAVIFGGILGDHPPRDRTGALRTHGFTTRVLGNRQMTTDTALLVCHLILDEGKTLQQIKFVDDPVMKTGEKESVEMPFRYVVGDDGEPILPPGLREHLADDEEDFF